MLIGGTTTINQKTQWNSFDQRSFFPHTDAFKMKIAICHEDLELINTLLKRGFDIDSVIEKKKKLTPIGLAAMLGRVDLIEFLFSRGSSLNLKDYEGNTPLMLAVIYDHPDAVKKLVELGCSLKEKDNYGFTAEVKAKNRGKDNIFKFLTQSSQVSQEPIVNPVTYKLEDYEYLSAGSAKKLIEKYQIKRYFKPVFYPYYKSSQGFLLYFFSGFDLDNFEQLINPGVFFNLQDDRCSSDQQLFSFGEALNQAIKKE